MSKGPHSHHILPTASNLLGFTFLVLTSIRGLKLAASKILIILTGVSVVAFAFSALLSFQSLKTEDKKTLINYEKWAARVFACGLVTCTILSVLIVFDIA